MSSPQTERRANPRYLCDDRFCDARLHYEGQSFSVTAINFNREGLGVFATEHLPNTQSIAVSFSFSDQSTMDIGPMECEVVYSQDTEVGDQYGLKFLSETIDSATHSKLQAIEKALACNDNQEDRYGLFSS